MQENPSQRSDRLLLALAIALQIALMAVVYWLAFMPRTRSQPPSKVRLEDYSLSNYGSLITVGTHDIPLTFDDEKTTGTTNIILATPARIRDILEKRNAVTVPAQDLMDIAPISSPQPSVPPLRTD